MLRQAVVHLSCRTEGCAEYETVVLTEAPQRTSADLLIDARDRPHIHWVGEDDPSHGLIVCERSDCR